MGVAPLHRSFFSDPTAVDQLGRALAGRIADPARITVAFDSEQHLGTIQLQLEPNGVHVPIQHEGDTVRLSDLAPITVALAEYRSDLAARLDFRLESFRVRLLSVRGLTSCVFDITGQAPPDGRTLSPCVTIDADQRCGQPTDDGVRFEAPVARAVTTCLDL